MSNPDPGREPHKTRLKALSTMPIREVTIGRFNDITILFGSPGQSGSPSQSAEFGTGVAAWRWQAPERMFAASGDDHGFLVTETAGLVGRRITSLAIEGPARSVRLGFDDDSSLHVFPDTTDEWEHWVIKYPDGWRCVAGPGTDERWYEPESDPVVRAFGALLGQPVERGELDRGGRVLRWLAAGSGETTVVFEAGSMSPVASFAAVIADLVADHRVIAYDRAGYGASDAVPFALEQQLDDLAAVLEQAGPVRRVLVGHSWGGLLAQLISWQRPELIDGLVLLDPAHEKFWQELSPDDLAEIGRHPDPTTPISEDPRSADVLGWARELAADVGRSISADDETAKLLVEACLSYVRTDEQLFRYLDEVPMIIDNLDQIAARRARASWPKVPVVVLTATKGRPADSTNLVIPIQEQVASDAGGRHIVVPDSGHYLHVDKPELVANCVRQVTISD